MLMLVAAALAAQNACDTRIIEGHIETPGAVHAAVAYKDGLVLSVGDRSEMPDTPLECVVRLTDDQYLFPGLTDAHVHLIGIGLRQLTLNLDHVRSVVQLKATLAEKAAEQPTGVISGRGWIETGWPEQRTPNKQDLDAVVSDRPVILGRSDGHAMVVNTAALEAVGIDEQTEDPVGGRIVRDATGAATGYLIDTAMDLVTPLLGEMTDARRREALKVGAEAYAALGWTSVHNMSVEGPELALMEELAAAGELPLRVSNFVVPAAMQGLIDQGTSCDDTGFVCHLGVKFYADGALGSRGALLKEPYADEPSTKGLRLLTEEDALRSYRQAAAGGLQVTTHAIGDQANADVLAWYKEVRKDYPDSTLRIEHAQIVDPEDLAQFAESGVIASMQPSHAIGDLHFAHHRLGMDRLRGAYAWNSLAQEGTLIVFGSDAPVEQGDPRIELYAANVRKDLMGFSTIGWHPEEALSRGESLALFTTSPALAIGRGGQVGTLAPGFAADFSVFQGDPFKGPANSKAVATLINGEVVSGALPSERLANQL
ncbi:MAG: amidohydrolase [Parvularculaceae bacterium]|nr:amidohydrolase [Parvularculaceae bacterium]